MASWVRTILHPRNCVSATSASIWNSYVGSFFILLYILHGDVHLKEVVVRNQRRNWKITMSWSRLFVLPKCLNGCLLSISINSFSRDATATSQWILGVQPVRFRGHACDNVRCSSWLSLTYLPDELWRQFSSRTSSTRH